MGELSVTGKMTSLSLSAATGDNCCTIRGPLFEAVQRTRLFKDSKTFVDCELKEGVSQEELVEAFQRAVLSSNSNNVRLVDFVNQQWFVFPQDERPRRAPTDLPLSLEQHIESMWDHLTLSFSQAAPGSTCIPLPSPVVVPGGRFREVYYWDSFFTGLGLVAAGRRSMLLSMVHNFTSLIHRFGYVPNGNRTYYLGRSQPPYYCGMVKALEKQGENVREFIPAVEREYQFWMQGAVHLSAEGGSSPTMASHRVVQLPCGALLNRYWDPSGAPRPESYWNDLELLLPLCDREPSGLNHGNDGHRGVQGVQYGAPEHEALFRNIRAAAESGWDFSTRWMEAGQTDLSKTITTDLIPVDLNVLLWEYEDALSNWYHSMADTAEHQAHSREAPDVERECAAANACTYREKAEMFRGKASARRAAMLKVFWDGEQGWWFDYNWQSQQHTGQWALSGMYPLAYGLADPMQARQCERSFLKKFLQPGGALTTWNPELLGTGQQWDCPNGWAPLQYISFVGLLNYGHLDSALALRERWLATVERTYRRTGVVLEKYNVINADSTEGGGGEYECQEGFGWTNGVHLALSNLEHWRRLHTERHPPASDLLSTPMTRARRASLGPALALATPCVPLGGLNGSNGVNTLLYDVGAL